MAITERYVTTAGAGSHDGTSEANAYSWSEMLTAINGGAAAGYRYNVKQGTYSLGASSTLTGAGSASAPLVIRGYKTTIGDGFQGRSAGGALNTANMPTVAYSAGFRIAGLGAYTVLKDLIITGNLSNDLVATGNANIHITGCSITNSSTSSSATCVNVNSDYEIVSDCDLFCAAGTTGGCITSGSNTNWITHCLIKNTGTGCGIIGTQVASISHCTIYECGADGIALSGTTRGALIEHCTIVRNTGDGIDFASGTTQTQKVVGCCITDNGGYGINMNGATAGLFCLRNRYRDNTSGAISGSADWVSGTEQGAVTTDTGDATTDYTSYTTDDYSLIASSPAINAAPGYLIHCGAQGTALGGGLKGFASA